MNIGAHIPSKNAIDEITKRKGDTFQIFISSPQMWKSPKPREDVDILQDFKGQFMSMHLISLMLQHQTTKFDTQVENYSKIPVK